METIQNYLDTMFQGIPPTQEVLRLKEELLDNMEDKYEELKAQGASENEAIGRVISEFGNIDELLKEMDIQEKNFTYDYDDYPTLNEPEIQEYIRKMKIKGKMVAFGVSLILFGASTLILLSQLLDDRLLLPHITGDMKDYIPILSFILFLVPAVGLFMYSGILMEKFKFIEKGHFYLEPASRIIIEQDFQDIKAAEPVFIITGVLLCILSSVGVFVGSMFGDNGSTYGVCVTMIFIAVAVNLFIVIGSCTDGYKKILKLQQT